MRTVAFFARIKIHAVAVIGGLIVAFAVIMFVELIGNIVYPLPAGLDATDPEALGKAMSGAPTGSLLFVLAAWGLGSYCGAWTAVRLVRPTTGLLRGVLSAFGMGRAAVTLERGASPMFDALVVGTILLFAGVTNLVMLPHPTWFTILGLLIFMPAAWVGGTVATRR